MGDKYWIENEVNDFEISCLRPIKEVTAKGSMKNEDI